MIQIAEDVIKYSNGIFLKSDSTLWAIGHDYNGRFATGKKKNDWTVPKIISTDVKDFYANTTSTAILKTNGDLLVSGQCYLPDYKNTYTFKSIASEVKFISCDHFITNKNELYSYGFNGYGALGLGHTNKSGIIKIMDQVISVSSNQDAALILTENGDVYGCGGKSPNYQGELGLGTLKAYLTPTLITGDVKKVYMGSYHSGIIKNDNSLWMCGANHDIGLM
mgnify:FL=1